MPSKALILLALSILIGSPVEAKSYRSPAVRAEFQRLNPCPDMAVRIRPGTAGGRRGACSKFQIDHRIPICFGGPDLLWNLQWLSVEDHKAKTKLDVKACAAKRAANRTN